MNIKFNYRVYRLFSLIPDRLYLSLYFRMRMKKRLNLKNPATFNEKLQWLKLYNRQSRLTELVDKIKVKKIIGDIIGEEHIIPTLGIWDKAEDIDFNSLPDKFVIKTNHSGGNIGVIICRDKTKLDKAAARKKLDYSLKYDDFYLFNREWPYKNVERKIFAEALLEDPKYPECGIDDFKFYCFNGKADAVMICTDRQSGDTKFYFFDRDWKLKRFNPRGVAAPEGFTLPRPKNIDKMFELADRLSAGFPFVRVDFYNIDGKIFFGEMTFFPQSGVDYNILPPADKYWGELIKLPQND